MADFTWDRPIFDLRAAGINVSGTEVEVLTEGGFVMCLAPLYDPSVYQGGESSMYDTSGQEVLVPLEVNVSPVNALFSPEWQHNRPVSLVEQMDESYDESWRDFPAYLGEMCFSDSDRWSEFFNHWAEEVRPYRVWSCKPLVDPADWRVLERLRTYTERRLDDCNWSEVDMILYVQATDEIDLESACVELGIVTPPKDWKPPFGEEFGSGADEFQADWIERVCQSYAAFCNDLRYFNWSWNRDKWDAVAPFEVGAMEDFIAPDDMEAYQVWTGIVARRERAKALVSRYYHGNPAWLDYHERFIA